MSVTIHIQQINNNHTLIYNVTRKRTQAVYLTVCYQLTLSFHLLLPEPIFRIGLFFKLIVRADYTMPCIQQPTKVSSFLFSVCDLPPTHTGYTIKPRY